MQYDIETLCTRLVNSPECFPYGKPLYTIFKFPHIPTFSCCCMILFSVVKHNMNSQCIKGNLKLIHVKCQCSASVIHVLLHHAVDYKHVCLLTDGPTCTHCDTHLTICKSPHFHSCWKDTTSAPYTTTISVCECSQFPYWTAAHVSSLVHLFRRWPFSNWHCTSTKCPALGPHTNIWQSNRLIWSLVSQEWNNETYFLTYLCTYSNSCL
jgi:hypothetical protein